MNFKCKEDFWLRVPYISYDFFINDLCKKNNKNINELIKKSNYEEGLLTSSRMLFESLHNERNLSETYYSSLKYLIRASTRPTPYGLNSAILRGKISKENNLIINNNFNKVAKPDAEWLTKVIFQVEKLLDDKLRVKVNNTLKFNKLTIEKMWNSFYSINSSIGGKKIINNTKAIQKIRKICEYEFVEIKKIIEIMKKDYKTISSEYLKNFIINLLDNEFLISDLRVSSVVTDQLAYVLDRIKEYSVVNNYFNELLKIKESFNKYNSRKVSEGSNEYIKLLNQMKNLCESNNYITIDMYQNDVVQIAYSNVKNIEEIANYLYDWGLTESYEKYVLKFLNKYGKLAVKYLDLIDDDIGIGVPEIDTVNSFKFKDDVTISFLRECLNHGENKEIDISKMINTRFHNKDEHYSMELAVYMISDKENIKYIISPIVGSTCEGKLEGRFKYLFIDNEEKPLEISDEVMDVEIIYPPCYSRHLNVQTTTPSSRNILEYGTYTENTNFNHISIEDIYVFVDSNKKLRFFDCKSKKIINFKISNAYNQKFCPPIIKPILNIIDNQKVNVFSLYYEIYHLINGLNKHSPRVVYKNIIILPETWKLDDRFIENNHFVDFNKFCELYKEYKNQYNIPSIVSLGPNDTRILINTDDMNHLKIMYDILKKDNNLLIYENLFNSDNLQVKNREGKPFVGEFIFTLENNEYKDNRYMPSTILYSYEKEKEITYFPFENWLFLKLYIPRSMSDKLLIFHISDLYHTLLATNQISDMFYIRYADPKEHIRLRIKINDGSSKIYKIIKDFIYKLKQQEIIINCVIEPYIQESERYGGYNNISYAENLFTKDSLCCIDLLKLKKEKILKNSLFDVYILSCLNLLIDMRISLEDQIEYLSDFVMDKESNRIFRKYNNYQFLEKAIDSDLMELQNSSEGIRILTILSERSLSAYNYWMKIENSDFTFERKKGIIQSILHMHFNRLIGINRNQENQAISYLRKFLFMKKNKLKYVKVAYNVEQEDN